MASIRKEIALENSAERVWSALRDFHAVDKRVAPGFVTHSVPDGNRVRVLTFANGSVAREELVDSDDTRRRLVYMISNERLRHYNAGVEVFEDGRNHCRFVWTVDLLPDALAAYVSQQMDDGIKAITSTLTRAS